MFSPSAEVKKYHTAETRLRALYKSHGENAVTDTINKWRRERMAAKRALRENGRSELAHILDDEAVLQGCIAAHPEHADLPSWKTELAETRKQIRAELDPTTITHAHAEEALRRISKQFAVYIDSVSEYGSPKLYDHEHEGLRPGSWSIVWEGYAEEWALRAFQGGVDPEVYQLALTAARDEGKSTTEAHAIAKATATDQAIACPQGIFAEPQNSCVLNLYPQD